MAAQREVGFTDAVDRVMKTEHPCSQYLTHSSQEPYSFLVTDKGIEVREGE